MPAARPHEQHRGLLVQLVRPAFGRRVIDPAANGVAQVDVTLDVVVPLRRVGVLEVGHEDAGARIQGVDDHLAVDRTGDLDPAIHDVAVDRRAHPVSVANRPGFREEIRQLAGVELALPRGAPREQLVTAAAERALQPGRERDRLGRQDLREFGSDAAGDLDAGTVAGGAHERGILKGGSQNRAVARRAPRHEKRGAASRQILPDSTPAYECRQQPLRRS
jgi:hypothetical protein